MAQRANDAIHHKNDAETDRIKEEIRKCEQLKEAEKRRREKQEDIIAKGKICTLIKKHVGHQGTSSPNRLNQTTV